ncbi:SGNH/GDSL hydrolase family protein [Oxobacter pfennigii]|uniref:SGNH/GDSL hydrolase family protein n=1 Tax=Oxobacter pfennigii TaxID=36849 RepID=UPI0006D3E351|nr:SGNH/GDSL hydrolase family protein [Oxobacter pfennigii]
MFNKIVCIGDSITKGKVWKENERKPYITEMSYPSILQKLLCVDVKNYGICDITSRQILENIPGIRDFNRESAVILEIGGNDCNLNWKNIKRNPHGSHEAAIPLEGFKNNLQKIVDTVKNFECAPLICTLPPLDPDRYYNLLKRVFGESIKLWIDKNGGIFNWQERYSNAVKEIAKKTGAYLIDIREAFLNTVDYRKYISIDGIHPNEDGYHLIARTCLDALKSIF